MKGFWMSFPEWSRFVRTTSPSTIVAHFHLIGVQEAVVGLISFRHQTAVLNPNRVNSTSLGSGVPNLFGPQIVMVLLVITERLFLLGVILKWSISFPSYHPNFPIGRFNPSSWLSSMHGFLREFFIYLFTGFYIIIAFCSLMHSFLFFCFFFILVETSSHSILCCYLIFFSRYKLSHSLFFCSWVQFIPRYLLLRCSFHVTVSPFNPVAVIRLCLLLFVL